MIPDVQCEYYPQINSYRYYIDFNAVSHSLMLSGGSIHDHKEYISYEFVPKVLSTIEKKRKAMNLWMPL